MANITVEQRPIKVTFECDYCDEVVEFEYKEFTSTFGEPCDWEYTKIECNHCKQTNEIKSWEFV